MIVVLCSSYEYACEYFMDFLLYLQNEMPREIREVFWQSNGVETQSDLTYIFIDCRYRKVFDQKTTDFIDVDEFMYDIYDRYYGHCFY